MSPSPAAALSVLRAGAFLQDEVLPAEGLQLDTGLEFAIALLIGALVGIEREKRKAEEPQGMGGVRTFTLFALVGALGAWLSSLTGSPWVLVAAVLGVSAAIAASYVMQARANPASIGLTTEVAGLAVCLLGALAVAGEPEIAVALAIATSALLAFKQPIHGLIGKLGEEDLYAGLKLLIATFIVLPVLPDRTIDPWGAINPYKTWLLVILISSLSLVGYVATRWVGSERGMAIMGLTGGLVSSTAVTLTFARNSRVPGAGAGAMAAGILLAWLVMFVRVVVEVAVVNRALVGAVLIPFATMAIAGLVAALVLWRATAKAGRRGMAEVPLKNPFSLTSAIKFALLFTAVLLVVKLVQQHFPGEGVYVVAALAGLTDVDAITLSMAGYARESGASGTAATAITIAAVANTLVKAGMVAVLGSAALRARVLVAAGGVLAAGAIALIVTSARS